MKILIYRWNSYNQNDIESAFKDAGCVCDIFNEKISNYENDPSFCEKLYTILKNGKYDFCFSINFFPLISGACHDTDMKDRGICKACPSTLSHDGQGNR